MMKQSIGTAFAILWLALVSSVEAEEAPVLSAQPRKPWLEIIPVTIHPATLPKPALKYRLLPLSFECKPGNAAALYWKAFLLAVETHDYTAKMMVVRQFTGMKAEDVVKNVDFFRRNKLLREPIPSFDEALRHVDLATEREQCDWGMTFSRGSEYNLLMPEYDISRDVAWLIAKRAQGQMVDQHYAEAIASLRHGYMMARHVSTRPPLGTAEGQQIVQMMNKQLLTLCQLPDSPNLYWSITALPKPIIRWQESEEVRYTYAYKFFRPLQTLREGTYTAERWDGLLREFAEKVGPFSGPQTNESMNADAIVTSFLAMVPAAKEALVAGGYSREKVEAMPPSQIALLYFVQTDESLRDDMLKCLELPYWQVAAHLKATTKLELNKKSGLLPMGPMWWQGLERAAADAARIERDLAALRCLEALRLYAALHEGKLPATLDEITEVPVPLNPFSGKPFGYQLDGETAVIDCGPNPGFAVPQYHVTMAK